MDNALWAFYDRDKRKDSLSSNTKDLVVQFWTKNTCVNLNMKDVVRRRIALKSWESHATHLLLETQVYVPFYFPIYLVC
jgi:hypothetical protein